MENFDLIVGQHSILEALQNSDRNHYLLVGTDESLELIPKKLRPSNTKIYSKHKVQEESKTYFKQLELEYQRVPSNLFLVSSSLESTPLPEFYQAVESQTSLRILALDQISDVHNAGAIVRTAAFYNVDYIIVPNRKSFGLTPSFFRIASGATEHVKLVEANKLSKTLSKLKELGATTIALSEHAQGDLDSVLADFKRNLVLVLGKEDTGISNAVMRVCELKLALAPQGNIKSLNVSIASAVAMEKCFGIS